MNTQEWTALCHQASMLCSKHGSIRAAARASNIPESTLRNRLKGLKNNKSKAVTPSTEDFVELNRLREDVSKLRVQNKELAEQINAELDIRKAVFKLADLHASPPRWLVEPQKVRANTPGMPILFSSDKQFGEVVKAEEVNGFNEYNVEIAEDRHRRLIESAIDLSLNHEVDPNYDGIIYVRGGDEISGEIHAELAETNQMSSIPAVQRLLDLEAWSIIQLKKHFKKVHVISVPGNHGRTTFKPRAKRYSDLNYETLLAFMLEREFRKDSSITFFTPKSGDAYFSVYNRKFLVTHGDRIGSRGGTGFIGPAATIARGMRKVIAQYAAMGKAVDYVLVGHFHTTLDLGFGFSNGSPVGYSEYAQMLRADPEVPQQWLLFAHPTRGITHGWKIQLAEPKAAHSVANPFITH